MYGVCHVDKRKQSAAVGTTKQTCYIQNPIAAMKGKYVVYQLSTCGSCLAIFTGSRGEVTPEIPTGIIAKDGIVLREVDGMCKYCSVLGGKCVKNKDCCTRPYSGYIDIVTSSSSVAERRHLIASSGKATCSDGRCTFESCLGKEKGVHNIYECNVGEFGRACCNGTCAEGGRGYLCGSAEGISTCTNKNFNLITCPGFGSKPAFCNCNNKNTPDVCQSNGDCKPCKARDQSCRDDGVQCCQYTEEDDANSQRSCIDKKCTRCVPPKTTCNADGLRCCSGTCKLVKGNLFTYYECVPT